MNYLALAFDPKFWIAAGIWSLLCFGAGDMNGSKRATDKAEGKAAIEQSRALQAQAEENARVLQAERDLRDQDRQAYDNFYKESNRAKTDTDRLIADLRAGIVRLRVPTVPASCRAPEDAGGQAAPGTVPEGSAELAPDAAIFLGNLLARGDDAIRKHGEVVDRYERLRLACTGQQETAP